MEPKVNATIHRNIILITETLIHSIVKTENEVFRLSGEQNEAMRLHIVMTEISNVPLIITRLIIDIEMIAIQDNLIVMQAMTVIAQEVKLIQKGEVMKIGVEMVFVIADRALQLQHVRQPHRVYAN